MSFVQRYDLWSSEQKEAAARIARIVEEQKLEVIRFSFPDQHGILRGKTLVASEALRALESGCTITTTMFAKDTSHRTVFPVFTAGGGFGMPEMEGEDAVPSAPAGRPSGGARTRKSSGGTRKAAPKSGGKKKAAKKAAKKKPAKKKAAKKAKKARKKAGQKK